MARPPRPHLVTRRGEGGNQTGRGQEVDQGERDSSDARITKHGAPSTHRCYHHYRYRPTPAQHSTPPCLCLRQHLQLTPPTLLLPMPPSCTEQTTYLSQAPPPPLPSAAQTTCPPHPPRMRRASWPPHCLPRNVACPRRSVSEYEYEYTTTTSRQKTHLIPTPTTLCATCNQPPGDHSNETLWGCDVCGDWSCQSCIPPHDAQAPGVTWWCPHCKQIMKSLRNFQHHIDATNAM